MEKISFTAHFPESYRDVAQLGSLVRSMEVNANSLVHIDNNQPFRTFLYDSETRSFTEIITNTEVKLPPKKWVVVGGRIHHKCLYIVYAEPFTLTLDLCSNRSETARDGFRLKNLYTLTVRMKVENPMLFLQKNTHLNTLLSMPELLHQVEQASSSNYVNGAAVRESLGRFLNPNGVKVLYAKIVKAHEPYDGKNDQQRDNDWNNTLLTTRRNGYVRNMELQESMKRERDKAQNDTTITYGKGQVNIALEIQLRKARLKMLDDFIRSLPAELRTPIALMAFAHEHGIKLTRKDAYRLCMPNRKKRIRISKKTY